MAVKNFYPELPEIPYHLTSVPMADVIAYAKTLTNYAQVYVRVAYAIFRNESANATRGVNNNYAGIQADNARWTKLPGAPIATCVKFDSGHEERRFLCFGEDGYKISFELLCIKCQQRQMKTPADYFTKWVGKKKWSVSEEKNFQSMLNQAAKLI
jgi:hypothetical protein